MNEAATDYMGEFPGCGEHFLKGHWYASVRILSLLPRQEKYRLVNQVSSTGLEQTYFRIRSNAEKRVTTIEKFLISDLSRRTPAAKISARAANNVVITVIGKGIRYMRATNRTEK